MKKITILTLGILFAVIALGLPKSVAVKKVHSSCLDTYLSFCENIGYILSVSTTRCASMFAYDPDENIQCQLFSHDVYNGMHTVGDAAYDRCMGIVSKAE
jgi:hypothetical protein